MKISKCDFFGYDGGTFSREEIRFAKEQNIPLTLDLAIPCGCRNSCFYCGYKQMTQHGLTFDEIFSIIDQFQKIGGKSIKILGEGEPFTRTDILEIIKYIHKRDLKLVLFTCGDVIGDENFVNKAHNLTSQEMVNRLAEFNTTVMLKHERENEDDIVQRRGFSKLRNRTLELLKETGFNKFCPSRLGFGIVVLKDNLVDIPGIYEKAIQENVYPLLCPLMPIGRVKDKQYRERVGVTGSQLVDLAYKLYAIAQEHRMNFTEPADFPGGRPCDISRAGLYIDGNGNVFTCEADDVVGNIREATLKDLWLRVSGLKDKKYGEYRWEGKCFPKRDAGVIPHDYDLVIRERLLK